ncbi:MAG TPA: Mur ligase family protein [Candidatus Paceibacterota bacterium]|nr:Mur ligase family protein [Candidatus Paceibacterota bacterium]
MTPDAELYYQKKLQRLADRELRMFKRTLPQAASSVRKIHLTGVCGTAMGSLAGLLKEAGYEVTGSDEAAYPPMSDQIVALGIPLFEGFKAENLAGADLVVIGNFSGPNNPEAKYARENNLPTLSIAEAFDLFFISGAAKGGTRKSLVVAGTHGKTTTTGLLAHLFEDAGKDPTYLVGGVLKNTDKTYAYGKGNTVIVEGDEYDTAYFDKSPKFLHYHPTSAVITSLEFDHIDIYDDLADYTQAFRFLAESIPEDGHLFLWGDDKNVRALAASVKCNIHFYGFLDDNQLEARNIETTSDGESFSLFANKKELGRVKTTLHGRHNILNTLAVCGMALSNGLSFEEIRQGLGSFAGMKRRQEIVGEVNGISVVDDFAHHPTAVRETIASIREKFPKRRLIAFFEPRSNTSRRKLFEEEYGKAFDQADLVYLSVPPLRHNDSKDDFIDEEKVAAAIIERASENGALDNGGLPKATFYPKAAELLKAALPHLQSGDVILIMSNGSFDGIHKDLLNALKSR